uniref:Uncharacterized protein n=1 Tax=Tetraselmis sp. GSL018 TaxID=582737 RepID=A0A061RHT9_9CHLO|eukprot:CAMPEP_0177585212 /NCGR_PEP_ID=MMETSP0419_2-20121207/4351_1 /TAXON_ID=582737 /ORGANISM="Tetraselmis sp., Strain GSL018" /LENGTH=214 /DNA_ID=CAMNT_0019074887 /DNA_START=133 /DNA_END=777 /DNA_ORIENTATION=+
MSFNDTHSGSSSEDLFGKLYDEYGDNVIFIGIPVLLLTSVLGAILLWVFCWKIWSYRQNRADRKLLEQWTRGNMPIGSSELNPYKNSKIVRSSILNNFFPRKNSCRANISEESEHTAEPDLCLGFAQRNLAANEIRYNRENPRGNSTEISPQHHPQDDLLSAVEANAVVHGSFFPSTRNIWKHALPFSSSSRKSQFSTGENPLFSGTDYSRDGP